MYSNDSSFAEGFIAGQNGSRSNDGMWGGDGGWFWAIIILFALFGWGGFGGWGGGFGGGANGTTATLDASLQRGFDTQTIISKLDGLTNGLSDGFYAMNTGMLNGFNGVSSAICNLGYEQAQLNNATNVAIMQGQNALQSQIADCCCTTQRTLERGFADTNYNMATNTCSIQTALANSTRDIIDSQRDGTRAILDYLCQEKIADLQSENQTLRLAASQERQNNYLISRLQPIPVPAYPAASPCGLGNWSSVAVNNGTNYGCGCGV